LCSQPIGEPSQAAAPPHDSPPIGTHDNMDSVPAKPRAFVEAVLRAARQPDLADQVQDRSLRRGTAGRKTEQHGLPDVFIAEAPHLSGHANVERRATRRAGDRYERPLGSPNARQQGASVERVQASAPPPPPGECERDAQRRKSPRPGQDDRPRDECDCR
jgi:hypothetical protein